jgi:hypothetical protein
MTMTLIERLSNLQGPDREVDALIWAEIDGCDVRWEGNKLLARSRQPPHDEMWIGTIDPGRTRRNFDTMSGQKPPIPRYTQSLDDAMTLKPEGYRCGFEEAGIQDGNDLCVAWCWPYESNFDPDWQRGEQGYRDAPDGFRAVGATPAIAITIAALRARGM